MEDVMLCQVVSVSHGLGVDEIDAEVWRWEPPEAPGAVAGRLAARLRAGGMTARVALEVGCRRQWQEPERVWFCPETRRVWDAREASGTPDAALIKLAALGDDQLELVLGDDCHVIAQDTVEHRGECALLALVVVPVWRCVSLLVGGGWELCWAVEDEGNALVLEELVMPVG